MATDPFEDYKVRYHPGEMIFRQGDVGTEMYIVRSGSVRVFRDVDGHKEPLSTLEKGDFFGEMAVLEGAPRADSAEAAEETELVRIHSAIFDRMIRRNTEIAVRMILKLSRRVEEANARLQDALQGKAAVPTAAAPVPPPPGAETAQLAAAPIPTTAPVREVSAAPAAGVLAELVLEGGKRTFPLRTDSALIGRYDPVTGDRPEIDLTSVDVGRSVSRRHARLLLRNRAFFLTEEVGALNGTFVGDRKVSSGMEVPLEGGDRIRVGRVVLLFRPGEPAP
ncbi:MAG: cyclic nucleotide-binding domain-containing protein [Acidobacteria bacterium]|nr:cyclic nucleotide-binding domain-containing protein [Acidobacteriota bacterium]